MAYFNSEIFRIVRTGKRKLLSGNDMDGRVFILTDDQKSKHKALIYMLYVFNNPKIAAPNPVDFVYTAYLSELGLDQ